MFKSRSRGLQNLFFGDLDMQGVTVRTVRTQLQSLFDKTESRRQPELVRALMAALSIVSPPE